MFSRLEKSFEKREITWRKSFSILKSTLHPVNRMPNITYLQKAKWWLILWIWRNLCTRTLGFFEHHSGDDIKQRLTWISHFIPDIM